MPFFFLLEWVPASWELTWSRETPQEQPFIVASKSAPPTNSEFKPALKLLSRKPPPKFAGQEDNESEEEERARNEREFIERQARAAKEREEKQRKYAEVRERLFGSPKPDEGTNATVDRTATSSRNSSRGKGRAARGDRDQQSHGQGQSPGRANPQGKKLFDPNYNPKPNSAFVQKRDNPDTKAEPTSDFVRQPRGPDGGRGFANRGNRENPDAGTSS